MRILLSIVLIINCFCGLPGTAEITNFQNTLGHLKPRSSPEDQAKAAHDLIGRYVGDKLNVFAVTVNPQVGPKGKDTFKITTSTGNKISIVGTSGVAVAWGFNYFLKNYCNSHIAWEGTRVKIPNVLPNVNVTITSNDRYYQNVCTPGYSFTWWKWDQWEKHIDWMALNGINLALAFTAQEAIWQRVYTDMGLTLKEINEHFGGPAFLPWSRMGNIRGWGGPLTPSWHNQTLLLQKQILLRMRELGIIPVLPAFAGHVPRAFTRIHPNAHVTKIGCWNKFEDAFCCPFLLSPTDPLFKVVGGKFLRAYISEFGTDHIYNCDTFNENEPQDTDLNSLKNIGSAVFSAMTEVDPQAIWLMQGWLFVHDFVFWTPPRVKAFVTSVPIGRMIVLDLQSEQFPQYIREQSYYGQPFIWCMLHDFGGTLGMFGSAGIINEKTFAARTMNGSTMIGTGLTPEGINQNYVIYDLMSEMAYRKKPVDLDEWFKNYATRRYGATNADVAAVWQSLGKTVYNFSGIRRIRGHYVITRYPSLNIKPWTWYDPKMFLDAWTNFTRAQNDLKNDTFYRHDLVDLTRQALQIFADNLYVKLIDSYKKKDKDNFKLYQRQFHMTMEDLTKILAASENFLLGKWLRDAKALATTPEESTSYEFNARNQITLWGPNGEIKDYAIKQWDGVMHDYILPRWALFTATLEEEIFTNTPWNETELRRVMFLGIEKPFSFYDNTTWPVEPTGNCVEIASELNNKWSNISVNVFTRREKIWRYKWTNEDSNDDCQDCSV